MDNKVPIRAILTGVTGMVGEGVLHECLQHPAVEAVLVINRKPCGLTHPRLTEILLPDFFDLSGIEGQVSGYNACFFCLGVSSIGLDEAEFTRLTYTLTLNFANLISQANPGMTFCYVSGAGTASTEQGRLMWARVKGKTENDLHKLPFKQVYAFRPGYMHPTPGLKNTLSSYKYFSWLYPLGRTLFPKVFCSLKEMGLAMIHAAAYGYEKPVLEVQDIVACAKRNKG
ncbi:MAG: epimerase [Saprospiraceae bacterium]|nr:epimerase [Saprospiraceae bacterium]